MKSSTNLMMKVGPRASSKMKSEIEHIDDDYGEKSATGALAKSNKLFDLVDADMSGDINRGEFERMYAIMKEQVHAEHVKEQELAKGKAKATRRLRLVGCLAMLLVFVVSILLAGNGLLIYLLIEATKETQASSDGLLSVAGSNTTVRVASADSHNQQGLMVDSATGGVIQTAPAIEEVPMRIAPALPLVTLSEVRTIVIQRDADANFEESYTQLFKVVSAKVYHTLYMTFECANGDTIVIDRDSVFIVDGVTGEQQYTCAANAECAAFMASGVNVSELTAEVDAAMAVWMNSSSIGHNTSDIHAIISNYTYQGNEGAYEVDENGTVTTLTSDDPARRQLNFAGHVHPDGSGSGCKITNRGKHKKIVGGMGTRSSPYIYRNMVGETCEYYAPEHRHQAGEPCSASSTARSRKRRQLYTSEGLPIDLDQYIERRALAHEEMHNVGNLTVLDTNSKLLVCPEAGNEILAEMYENADLEAAILGELCSDIVDATGFKVKGKAKGDGSGCPSDWSDSKKSKGRARELKSKDDGKDDGKDTGVNVDVATNILCVKSLWNIYQYIMYGDLYQTMFANAQDYCDLCSDPARSTALRTSNYFYYDCHEFIDPPNAGRQYGGSFGRKLKHTGKDAGELVKSVGKSKGTGGKSKGTGLGAGDMIDETQLEPIELCELRRKRGYIKEIIKDAVIRYAYDSHEDLGLIPDEVVAEAVAIIMAWYDVCEDDCEPLDPLNTVSDINNGALNSIMKSARRHADNTRRERREQDYLERLQGR